MSLLVVESWERRHAATKGPTPSPSGLSLFRRRCVSGDLFASEHKRLRVEPTSNYLRTTVLTRRDERLATSEHNEATNLRLGERLDCLPPVGPFACSGFGILALRLRGARSFKVVVTRFSPTFQNPADAQRRHLHGQMSWELTRPRSQLNRNLRLTGPLM
jgi:hypothetical protein